jgi:diaminohydroxyphosphoribosylaminopyrimidine deaminase/5-amino-6-(5-phosphoribosylamino)uracil reductase
LQVLAELGARGVTSVLIEGGASVLGQAFEAQVVDEVHWYIAPRISGAGLPSVGGPGLTQSVELKNVKIMPMGDNVCITGQPVWPQKPVTTP